MYVLSVVVDIPLFRSFSYFHEVDLEVGRRVLVEFGVKRVVGFVWYKDSSCNYPLDKLKPILHVYSEKIDPSICKLVSFCSSYYHYPIGATLFNVVVPLYKKPKEYKSGSLRRYLYSEISCDSVVAPIMLNTQQQTVVKAIVPNLTTFYPTVLYGVTGSGKTEVYLELISKVILSNRQVLVLVPEINLTPQILRRFLSRFPTEKIVVLTSYTSSKLRYDSYLDAQDGNCQIVIGTRLSIFTPFKDLGLIIVDEEHDQSFKQNEYLRYQARDLAIWRAKQLNIPVILGSATPSLETLFKYKRGDYNLYKLTNRAVENAKLPHIELIDLNGLKLEGGLSTKAIKEIGLRLQQKQLSLVFINRRGYATSLVCDECGWVFQCNHCSTSLVYHRTSLKCHQCGFSIKVPVVCFQCKSPHLYTRGDGTQQVEEVLRQYFGQAKICRIDQDTIVRKSDWDKLYVQIYQHEVDILVGTQMLVKGHDFHNLTLVVGLNLDSALYSHDFRASELLFTQLTQVAGRSGRGSKSGLVLLQTKYPQHELYHYLLQHDFSGFVNYLMLKRKSFCLPPYSYYAIFRAQGQKLEYVLDYLNGIVKLMSRLAPSISKEIIVYPALAAVLQKLKNKERGQILVQCVSRNHLQILFDKLVLLLVDMKPKHAITWSIDIDPYDM